MAGVGGIHLAAIHLEDTGGIVHGTTYQTGKGQDGGVVHRVASKTLVLGSSGALVSDKIGICAANARRTYCLVGINCNLVLGCLLDTIQVVVVEWLAIVVFAIGDDVAYISALHAGIAPLVHQFVGLLQMAFVINRAGTGLVVHYHLHTLLLGIAAYFGNVKVGIWCNEVEDIVLLLAKPVLPTFIPSFHQNGIKAVLCGEVDIVLHMLGVGTMLAIGFQVLVVGNAQLHTIHVIGICPGRSTLDHFPPHTYVLCGLYPTGILYLAGFVQVQSHAAGKNVCTITANDDRTPRGAPRCLHVSLVALCIGGEVADEHHASAFGPLQCQVHCGIIYASRLMQVDEIAVLGLHQQGGLYRCGTCRSLATVRSNGLLHPALYLAEPCCLPLILLGIIVTCYPPRLVVSGQRKLALLFLNNKIGKILLAGELISESQAVIEHAEANRYLAVVLLLIQSYEHFIIVVAYLCLLAPNGNPRLVEGGCLYLSYAEVCLHISTLLYLLLGGKLAVFKICSLFRILFLELETEITVGNDSLAIHLKAVDGASLGIKTEVKFHLAVGAGLLLCISCHSGKADACNSQ